MDKNGPRDDHLSYDANNRLTRVTDLAGGRMTAGGVGSYGHVTKIDQKISDDKRKAQIGMFGLQAVEEAPKTIEDLTDRIDSLEEQLDVVSSIPDLTPEEEDFIKQLILRKEELIDLTNPLHANVLFQANVIKIQDGINQILIHHMKKEDAA